jgi:hypothetical protein
MSAFTPGPWTVFCDDTGGEFTGWPSVQAPEYLDTAVVHRAGFRQKYWGDLSQRECIANARLISAAPELLAELSGWLPIVERQLASLHPAGRDSKAYQFALARIERTRAAIAKATTGETTL